MTAKTMREAYELYRSLYASQVEQDSIDEAMMRGAFSAGVVYGLEIAKLKPDDALAAIERMSAQLDDFWQREKPQ